MNWSTSGGAATMIVAVNSSSLLQTNQFNLPHEVEGNKNPSFQRVCELLFQPHTEFQKRKLANYRPAHGLSQASELKSFQKHQVIILFASARSGC
jgi:hypothetical protein